MKNPSIQLVSLVIYDLENQISFIIANLRKNVIFIFKKSFIKRMFSFANTDFPNCSRVGFCRVLFFFSYWNIGLYHAIYSQVILFRYAIQSIRGRVIILI